MSQICVRLVPQAVFSCKRSCRSVVTTFADTNADQLSVALSLRWKYQESAPGGGPPAGLVLSSGSGTNSLLSAGGKRIRPCFQSSLACSIRSFRLDTKFHQMYRSPRCSPPSIINVVCSFAMSKVSTALVNTNNFPSV